MKAFVSVTVQFINQIFSDWMLIALFVAPLLIGSVFRFAIPALEMFLCGYFIRDAILAPYFPIFDLVLITMTPLLFTSAGAMIMLDEADLGLTRAISVTPVGRIGYLGSRVGVPAITATVLCFLIYKVFGLSGIEIPMILSLSLCAGALGIVVSLMITSLAGNKVEGLALTKLSGLLMAGIPVALLVPAPIKYMSGILPTYWMTEAVIHKNWLLTFPAMGTALLWIMLFLRKFSRKVLA
ncbi:MAG: hypothetical protein GXY43_00965 [Clostridiaceae bacterium]|nr:hypothetical protein [Clostridiaceae bacterium]